MQRKHRHGPHVNYASQLALKHAISIIHTCVAMLKKKSLSIRVLIDKEKDQEQKEEQQEEEAPVTGYCMVPPLNQPS